MYKIFLMVLIDGQQRLITGSSDIMDFAEDRILVSVTYDKSALPIAFYTKDIIDGVITAEGQEVFKVRNGVVVKDYKEFMETLMIGSDIHGVKTEVNEVIKQYQEWCGRLEMSQNNLKGLMKAVTKETNMIMAKSNNKEEAKKVIEECKEQLSK